MTRDAKSEEHEERVPAIFPPAVLIFGPTQKNMLKYAKICCANSLGKKGVPANFYAFCISAYPPEKRLDRITLLGHSEHKST